MVKALHCTTAGVMARGTALRRLGLLALLLLGGALSVAISAGPAAAGDSYPACDAEAASGVNAAQPGSDYASGLPVVQFINECGQLVPMGLEIAASPQQRETGLMNVTYLPPDQGEIFLFGDLNQGRPVLVSFWMEDTYIPLSIAFLSKDGIVQEIQDMAPLTTDMHTPAEPYLFAIEANQGWFAQHNIVPGSYVDLTPVLMQLPAGTASVYAP